MKLRIILGSAVSLACLAYVLREVDFARLWVFIKNMNPMYVVWVNALAALSIWVRSLRWSKLLAPVAACPAGSLFSANLIGFMANNILPARMGELVRAYAAARIEPVPASSVLATLVLERILDGLTLILLLFVTLLFADPNSQAGAFNVHYLRGVGYSLSGVYLGVLALMAALWRWPEQTVVRLGGLGKRLSPKLGEKIARTLESFHQGLAVMGSAGRLPALVLLSLGVWLPVLGIFICFLPAMGIRPDLLLGALAMSGASLGAAVPAGPGFVGAFQLAVTWSLMIGGVDQQTALAYSLAIWAVQYFPLTAAGLIEMWRRGLAGKLF